MKGEVNGCDLVAVRRQEAPVIVELKTRFSLALVLQGISRQRLTDNVYLAVPPFSGRGVGQRDALALCRRARARNADRSGSASAPGKSRPGSGPLPTSQAKAASRPAPSGVSAPGRGPDARGLHPSPRHDGLSAGLPPLRRTSGPTRPDESGRVGTGHGSREGGISPARRPLWMVRTRTRNAARHLPPDATGARSTGRTRTDDRLPGNEGQPSRSAPAYDTRALRPLTGSMADCTSAGQRGYRLRHTLFGAFEAVRSARETTARSNPGSDTKEFGRSSEPSTESGISTARAPDR